MITPTPMSAIMFVAMSSILFSCAQSKQPDIVTHWSSIEYTITSESKGELLLELQVKNQSQKQIHLNETQTEVFANGLKIGDQLCHVEKKLNPGEYYTVPIVFSIDLLDITPNPLQSHQLVFNIFGQTSFKNKAPASKKTIAFEPTSVSFDL